MCKLFKLHVFFEQDAACFYPFPLKKAALSYPSPIKKRLPFIHLRSRSGCLLFIFAQEAALFYPSTLKF